MGTSDTSSVLWAVVQNDWLIYEKACTMKGDLYSPNCHSMTLRIQNRGLGVFLLVQKMGRCKFMCFRRGCEWEQVSSHKCSSACEAKPNVLTKVSLLTLGTQSGSRKEIKKTWKSNWNAVVYNLLLHISSNTNKILLTQLQLVGFFSFCLQCDLKKPTIYFPLP